MRLPATLASVRALEYPRDLIRAIVVADNCWDDTAGIARAAGVDVIERRNHANVGKGHALAHGLAAAGDDYDAVLFMDADCTLEPHTLRSLDARLCAGDRAIQAYYTMSSPGGSATVPLRELALTLVHRLRPRAKERVGASAGVKGSGMCFSRETVDRVGWAAHGLAEDVEQHNALLRAGIRVAFADDVTVTGHAPATLSASAQQHRRWEAGRASAARRDALPLLARGIRTRSVPMIDAAIEMLVPPISLVAAMLVVSVAAALAIRTMPAALVGVGGLTVLSAYVCAGVALSRIPAHDVIRAAVAAPAYVAWKVMVYARALFAGPERWEPTRRE
jgi:cellulose synthase/poly-beta-1,6-N-acetylglucosamine synthase-like glycosyltransferase